MYDNLKTYNNIIIVDTKTENFLIRMYIWFRSYEMNSIKKRTTIEYDCHFSLPFFNFLSLHIMEGNNNWISLRSNDKTGGERIKLPRKMNNVLLYLRKKDFIDWFLFFLLLLCDVMKFLYWNSYVLCGYK